MSSLLRRIAIIVGAALLAAFVGGCGGGPQTVNVLVSEELKSHFDAISSAFSKENSNIRLNPTVMPAEQLTKQIAAGKLDGILLTLGPKDLVPIDKAGRLKAGSEVVLGDVPLVVAVGKCGLCKFEALGQKHVTSLAIGDVDSGAVGVETMNALAKAKLWESVKGKATKMSFDSLMGAVESGKFSAAIVALTQVNGRAQVGCYIDEKLHQPIQLLAVKTSGLKETSGVSKFFEFLDTKAAKSPLYEMGVLQHKAVQLSGNSLFFYCGAGLREASTKLVSAFRKKTGITVFPTYTGSGCLLAQITIGQSGDLYMPGEDWYMKQAEERGYIVDSKVVTYMIPVIMVQKGNPKKIAGLTDLLKPGMRVGMGEPKSAAIGDFTLRLLESNKIPFETFKKNVAATFGTAPELGNSVKLGAVDAAIQWDAVAAWYLDEVDVVPIPTDGKNVSPVPLGVLKFSKHPVEAKAFLDFVSGPEGRAVFEKAGYTMDLAHPRFPLKTGASK